MPTPSEPPPRRTSASSKRPVCSRLSIPTAARPTTAALADARRRGEDASLAVDELQRRLVEAEDADQEAERRRRYADAKAKRDKLAAEFEPRYREHVEGLLALLRETAEADAEIDRVNDDLPAEFDPDLARRGDP